MKGAFELGAFYLICFPIIIICICFIQIMMNYNDARYMQDYILNTIERQNRYDDDVEKLIADNKDLCRNCSYTVTRIDNKYKVEMSFPISIPLINYTKDSTIVGYTQIIG